MPETLRGTVERITFHNPENGFSVLRVRVPKRRDAVTVVGNTPSVSVGEAIEAEGDWKRDPQHGLQLQAVSISIRLPGTREGILRYLGSGAVQGIGPHIAGLLVEKFGSSVFEVIESHPEKLRTIRGIGAKRALKIRKSWNAQRGVRDLMVFLASHGVGSARAIRIHKEYGANAIGLIRENPYRLADEIRGIGFRGADSIARSLGLDAASPARVRAGLAHVLSEARSGAGNCGLPVDELVRVTTELLGVDRDVVAAILGEETESSRLIRSTVRGTAVVFLPWLYYAEDAIARKILILMQGRPPWPEIDAHKAIPWVEKKSGMALSPSQRDAIERVLESKVSIITGGPGVGKTTIVNSLLKILSAKGVEAALAAPTGRAAKRLGESTARIAKTIHRLLEVNARTGRFARDETNPLDCDFVIIDETSMVDVPLMDSLMRAIPSSAALLLVGDVDQLPSVGPGQVLADLIGSGVVPVVRLTEIFRQAEASRIIVNAHRINEGRMPEMTGGTAAGDATSDFYFVSARDPDEACRKILQIVSERIPARFGLDAVTGVQVLAPMHKGGAGVQALNAALQEKLNARGLESTVIERAGTRFAVGDKVMQIENDYDKDVFNGDIGTIRWIDREEDALNVDFQGWSVDYGFDELDKLVLAYATTIHKSQGSEYQAVVIPILKQHWIMLERNLLYTAVTRGRQLVVLVGEKAALARAVKHRRGSERWTRLLECLTGSGPQVVDSGDLRVGGE